MFRDRLTRIRARIEEAARRSGRAPSAVTLIGVTKTVPVERIQGALACGLADVGENRVQEARARRAALGPAAQTVRWHLIGHLQRNKAKDAIELFDLIHSVDSQALLETLGNARGEPSVKPKDVLIQVNVSGERTKFGCVPDDALRLAQVVGHYPLLRFRGLMTMAPLSQDPEQARPHFRRLRELRDHVASALSLEPTALSLSMGMSQDFEIAIEEGADLVRIGTALFGEEKKVSDTFGA